MCGRFAYYETEDIEERFGVTKRTGLHVGASYNIAPGQVVPVIHGKHGDIVVEGMRWGYLPSWAKDEKIGYRMINARDDAVEVKPAWRGGIRHGRCLIPANGFYEWKKDARGKGRIPFFIRPTHERTFAMAGISNIWTAPDGSEIPTFAIITTSACKEMEDIHDRMPVILEESEEMEWLSANTGQKELSRLLKPYSGGLEVMQVSTAVNSAKHNTSHLVQALPDNEEAAEREPQ